MFRCKKINDIMFPLDNIRNLCDEDPRYEASYGEKSENSIVLNDLILDGRSNVIG